ncbi:MAG TPA: zinc ribbon domain-containing protein [Patescibacteria group bacterium]|nr:zinc ribbon domain-containing protein [Patescibacteria group bacterium]
MKQEICQSCGMPLKKDEQHGGSERDGSKSKIYCSLCYNLGEFRQDMSLEEMMALVENVLVEKRIPRFMAKFLAKQTPKLDRWREDR